MHWSGCVQQELFKPSPSVNKTSSAKPSCESTGPTRQSTTTCEPSTQIDLEELTSSSVGFLASPGPKPGSSEAQKMTVISGRKWLALLESYGHAGLLAKMCAALLTNQWGSSAAFLTWKASGIKPSHLLLELAVSMRRTDATESGLLHTPTAKANQMAPSMKSRDPGSWWPTPMARDYKDTPTQTDRGLGSRDDSKLTIRVFREEKKMWPTPTANEDACGTPNGKMQKMMGNHPEVRNTGVGTLNPQWVEWLMGFPTGWTDLKPSEMPSSRKSSRKSEER